MPTPYEVLFTIILWGSVSFFMSSMINMYYVQPAQANAEIVSKAPANPGPQPIVYYPKRGTDYVLLCVEGFVYVDFHVKNADGVVVDDIVPFPITMDCSALKHK